MKDKFGQFDWKCWKDVKPEPQRFVYTYFPDAIGGVDISLAEEVKWDDEDYWCYVFIPDAPKIEEKYKKNEVSIEILTIFRELVFMVNRLQDQVRELEKKIK